MGLGSFVCIDNLRGPRIRFRVPVSPHPLPLAPATVRTGMAAKMMKKPTKAEKFLKKSAMPPAKTAKLVKKPATQETKIAKFVKKSAMQEALELTAHAVYVHKAAKRMIDEAMVAMRTSSAKTKRTITAAVSVSEAATEAATTAVERWKSSSEAASEAATEAATKAVERRRSSSSL
jgi:hypothetical protein